MRNDLSAGAIHDPGVNRLTEESGILTGPDAAVGVEDMVRQRDRRRNQAAGRVQAADDRAQAGKIVRRTGIGVLEIHRRVRPAREHVITARRVGVVAARHGPQHAKVMGESRRPREELAQLQPRHRRRDRPEFATNFGRRLRLRIPRRMLRRPAHQKQHDAVLWPARCHFAVATSSLLSPRRNGSAADVAE